MSQVGPPQVNLPHFSRRRLPSPGPSLVLSETRIPNEPPPPYELHDSECGSRTQSIVNEERTDAESISRAGCADKEAGAPTNPRKSPLFPRIAVILGIDRRYGFFLALLRGTCMLPAVYWAVRCGLTLILAILAGVQYGVPILSDFYVTMRVVELCLALVWIMASSFLCFFFTDHLMTRWMVHYSPRATLVRLITLNLLYFQGTSLILGLFGGKTEPRWCLPAWVFIASLLALLYHIANMHTNIRRETRVVVRLFWTVSYISMGALLFPIYYHGI